MIKIRPLSQRATFDIADVTDINVGNIRLVLSLDPTRGNWSRDKKIPSCGNTRGLHQHYSSITIIKDKNSIPQIHKKYKALQTKKFILHLLADKKGAYNMNKNEIYFNPKKTISNGYEKWRIQKQVDGIKISVVGKTRKEAVEKAYAKLDEAKHSNNLSINVSKITFADFVKYYLYEVVEPTNSIKDRTFVSYTGYYNNHIKNSHLAKVKLIDMTRENIQIFINSLLKKDIKLSTIKQIKTFVSTVLNYAVSGDLITKNYCRYVKLPKDETVVEKHKFLTDDEIQRLLANCKDYQTEMLIRLILNTGLRVNEALALTVKDVEKQVVNVDKTLTLDKELHIVVGTPKTKTSVRQIPINDTFNKELKKYILYTKEKRLKLGIIVQDDCLLFASITNQYIKLNNIGQRLNTLYKKSNVNASGFHVLRHTFGSKLFENGVDLKTISALMGHNNISITADVYVHLSPDSKINAIKILNF